MLMMLFHWMQQNQLTQTAMVSVTILTPMMIMICSPMLMKVFVVPIHCLILLFQPTPMVTVYVITVLIPMTMVMVCLMIWMPSHSMTQNHLILMAMVLVIMPTPTTMVMVCLMPMMRSH